MHALQMIVAVVIAIVGLYEVVGVVVQPGLVAGHASDSQLDLSRSMLIATSGLVIGVLSGLTGVGGGIFVVPIMVLGFGLSQHLAQGSSLVAVLPTAAVGAFIHYRHGNVDARAAVWIGGVGRPPNCSVRVLRFPSLRSC